MNMHQRKELFENMNWKDTTGIFVELPVSLHQEVKMLSIKTRIPLKYLVAEILQAGIDSVLEKYNPI